MESSLLQKVNAIILIDDVHDDRFNDILADIQEDIGVATGDFASIFFSGVAVDHWLVNNKPGRRVYIATYIQQEIAHNWEGEFVTYRLVHDSSNPYPGDLIGG